MHHEHTPPEGRTLGRWAIPSPAHPYGPPVLLVRAETAEMARVHGAVIFEAVRLGDPYQRQG